MIEPYKMIAVNMILSALLLGGILFYRYLYPKKKINYLLLIFLISLLPVVSIFRKGTYEAGDLTLHSVFLQSFYENLSQGIFIPQWAGNLCGGYGCPSHLFEYPLPYYISSLFRFFGFSYINSIKIFLAVSFIFSGIGMYLWLKQELGDLFGFVGGIFYLFAPYHLEDLHYRVSVGEVLSYFPIPFIFYFFKKLAETKKIRFLLFGSFSIALLALSHGNALMSISPVLLIYCSFLVFKANNKKQLALYFITSLILGFLLSAFYWLPVLFEVKYTWYELGFITKDFKPFLEYIYSPARYGLLFQGQQGELRLIVGYFHLLAVFAAIFLLVKKSISNGLQWFLILLLINFFIYFFMLQQISQPLWNILPLFHTFILPWRLLIPIAFITSAIAAIVAKNVTSKKILFLICFLTAFSTILNWGNRKMVPEDIGAYAKHWSMYSEYFEPNNPLYLSRFNQRVPQIPKLVLYRPTSPLEILSGTGELRETGRTQINHEYLVHADTDMLLSENTYYFPGWMVYVNGNATHVDIQNKKRFGTLVFPLKKGLYLVDAKFKDTPVRKAGKYISLLSLLLVILICFMQKTTFKRRSSETVSQ